MAFSVTRKPGCLVSPSEPTPAETLYLSIIDRVPGLRHLVRSLHVFKRGKEPAKVIKEALSRALVKYYPFAGRFVDSEHGDVRVACTGEGAWFVEATADCSLEDVNYLDHPLLITPEDLLPEPSQEIEPINLPVMMQITEFTCGGFVVGLVSVHTMADGLGAAQFINTIGELARGLEKPTVNPVWSRELIPNPPKLPPGPPPNFHAFNLQHLSIDISPNHISDIKAQYFESLGQWCSTFDVSIAKAWQARTRAIKLSLSEEVHVCFFANTRQLLHQVMPSEGGYYGNCFYPVTATATSKRIVTADLIDVVKIIRDAKAKLPGEFAKWAVGNFEKDPYELSFTYNSLFVSDWTKLGFLEVDYGWGPPVHALPFAYNEIMAVAIIGAPPAPKKGTRIMMQCVKKEHMKAFQNEMKSFS